MFPNPNFNPNPQNPNHGSKQSDDQEILGLIHSLSRGCGAANKMIIDYLQDPGTNPGTNPKIEAETWHRTNDFTTYDYENEMESLDQEFRQLEIGTMDSEDYWKQGPLQQDQYQPFMEIDGVKIIYCTKQGFSGYYVNDSGPFNDPESALNWLYEQKEMYSRNG